tara:strand:+ start:7754 stop:8164 length:411 start_codon:yes stop_codon:yes gene_type:complete
MSIEKTTYQGTVLDNLNPSTTVANVDSLLNLYRGYDKQDKDALRHYLGTQALSSKFGPFLTKLMTDFNEWPSPDDEHSIVDLANNAKALEDMKSGNMFNPSWIEGLEGLNPQTSPQLDSLLQHLVLPPSTEEYPSK